MFKKGILLLHFCMYVFLCKANLYFQELIFLQIKVMVLEFATFCKSSCKKSYKMTFFTF
jgi:hypothetical protein